MGVNNRQRRAAKQRSRARQRSGRPDHPDHAHFSRSESLFDDAAAYAHVELQVLATLRRIAHRRPDDAELEAMVESLVRRSQPHSRELLTHVVAAVLDRVTAEVTEAGWGRGDLVQLVRRVAGPAYLPALDGDGSLAAALRVAALLSTAPRLETGALLDAAGDTTSAEHPKLARVRSLLAKAESTDFDEEAEALSAKAQQLITKYALGRLVDDGRAGTSGRELGCRRLWLDPPYVGAKAALVHEVAMANRSRSASAEQLGFCVLIGTPADLDAVELLVTSLLVQADAAMLRHGRRFDSRGGSRTRSFRRSFLLAYATRIGDRLRAAAEAVVEQDGTDCGDLLPILADHEAAVDDAFRASLPHTTEKRTTFSSPEGWAAGTAAADLALLDAAAKLTP